MDQSSLDYGKGDIPALNNWDGVTCVDSRERLLFENAKSYGQLVVRNQEPFKIDNYTVEMWVKPIEGF